MGVHAAQKRRAFMALRERVFLSLAAAWARPTSRLDKESTMTQDRLFELPNLLDHDFTAHNAESKALWAAFSG